MQDTVNTETLQVEDLDSDLQKFGKVGVIRELEKRLIDPKGYYVKPDPIISIGDKPYGTRGNISTITAKPKVGKSMACSLLVATVLKSGCVKNMTSNHTDCIALYFDTEQGPYHAHLQAKRITALSGEHHNLKYFTLRTEDDEGKRLGFIQTAIENYEDVSLVIIDGIADVTTSGVNDEEQSKVVVNKLMKWSAEQNVHIICILHQNKGNENAKGHLGSHLLQKSETVISLEKNFDCGIIKIEPTHSRGIPFEPFYMSIDDFGMPYVTGEPEPLKSDLKKKIPHAYDFDFVYGIAKDIFRGKDEINSGDFLDEIGSALDGYEIHVGASYLKKWKTFLTNEKMVKQSKPRSPYKINKTWVSS